MSDEHKKRVQAAMEAYHKKLMPKPRRAPNGNPEGEFVLVLKHHLEALDWSIDVVEAKAVYSEESGRYMNGKTRPGFPDICGNTPDGHSVWIEVKAPGRRSTIRPDQREFLLGKIATNCFAICCDSIQYFERVFSEWQKVENKKAFLLKELPTLAARFQDSGDWFDDEA